MASHLIFKKKQKDNKKEKGLEEMVSFSARRIIEVMGDSNSLSYIFVQCVTFLQVYLLLNNKRKTIKNKINSCP